MQNQWQHMQQMSGMQRNMLRDYPDAVSASVMMQKELKYESLEDPAPFPAKTPPGMAYVPFQQWEEPYDLDKAFPIGTIFPALNYPYSGGGCCA